MFSHTKGRNQMLGRYHSSPRPATGELRFFLHQGKEAKCHWLYCQWMKRIQAFNYTHRDAWRRDVGTCHGSVESDTTLTTKNPNYSLFWKSLLPTQLYHYCILDKVEYSDEISSLFFNDIQISASRWCWYTRDTYKLFERYVEVPCEIDTPVIQNFRGRSES